MATAQKTNTTPVTLINSANLQLSVQAPRYNRNESQDNVHVRFAANIGRLLHARAVRQLGKVLARHSDVFAAYTDNLITIPAPASYGFSMSIETDRGRCTVVFGQWEDDFASAEAAVALIEDALQGDVRLRVDINDRETRWTLERRLPDGNWVEQPRGSIHAAPPSHARHMRSTYLHNDFRRMTWRTLD